MRTVGNLTVNQSDTIPQNCVADGNPAPNINWTKLPENTPVNFPLTISGKQDEGFYRCTADNGIGNAITDEIFITVESKSTTVNYK